MARWQQRMQRERTCVQQQPELSCPVKAAQEEMDAIAHGPGPSGTCSAEWLHAKGLRKVRESSLLLVTNPRLYDGSWGTHCDRASHYFQ